MFVRKKTVDKIVEDYEAKIEQIMADYETTINKLVREYECEVEGIRISIEDGRQRDQAAFTKLATVLNNKKATKADMTAAMEEAVGYLGENLEG